MSLKIRTIGREQHEFPHLDGLRGLAILLVLLVHTAGAMNAKFTSGPVHSFWAAVDPIAAMGGSGVHLFFVLSGYLLFLPFARRLLANGSAPGTLKFYKRRLLRILPAYYVALVFVWLVFERDTVSHVGEQFLSHVLLIHNYSTMTFKGLDGPTWTMAVEAQFYVLLPLLGALSAWLLSRGLRALVIGAVGLLLSSPVVSTGSVILQHAVPAFRGHVNILEPFELMATFACGIIGACIYVLAQENAISRPRQHQIATAGITVFTLVFIGYLLRRAFGLGQSGWDYYTFASVMGVCYGGLLLHVILEPARRVGRLLSQPGLRFIGDVSFSLYLLHEPILIGWLVPATRGMSGIWPVMIVTLGLIIVVLALATASFLFIETPFLQRRPFRSPRLDRAEATAKDQPCPTLNRDGLPSLNQESNFRELTCNKAVKHSTKT